MRVSVSKNWKPKFINLSVRNLGAVSRDGLKCLVFLRSRALAEAKKFLIEDRAYSLSRKFFTTASVAK